MKKILKLLLGIVIFFTKFSIVQAQMPPSRARISNAAAEPLPGVSFATACLLGIIYLLGKKAGKLPDGELKRFLVLISMLLYLPFVILFLVMLVLIFLTL